MTTRTIYLVRHGQYFTNSGSTNQNTGSLTEQGKQQARFVADYFIQLPIKTLYASSLPRAMETARIIADKSQQEVIKSDLLQESIPSIPPKMNGSVIALMHVSLQLSHTTLDEDLKRSEKAFEIFFKPPLKDEQSFNDIIVCHGNIIRFFMCKLLAIDIDNWIKFRMNHCGISCVTIEDTGAMKIVSHNETKHMPFSLLSEK